MIVAGSVRSSGISKPIMDLVYECTIFRNVSTYTAVGSQKVNYVLQMGVVPCDVSPVSIQDRIAQAGQTQIITYVVHLPAGANIQKNDAITVVSSRTGFGPIGQSFYMVEVLLPSENISYVRCHAVGGKEPTTGAS